MSKDVATRGDTGAEAMGGWIAEAASCPRGDGFALAIRPSKASLPRGESKDMSPSLLEKLEACVRSAGARESTAEREVGAFGAAVELEVNTAGQGVSS